jgi:HPt (histidine-containing phosphotransfer) domain-containing protein
MATQRPSQAPLVDRARLDAVTNGDAQIRAELVELFAQQARRRVADCCAAADGSTELLRAAHALRGSAESFGAPRLAQVALSLETAAPPPEWRAALGAALDATLEQLARL